MKKWKKINFFEHVFKTWSLGDYDVEVVPPGQSIYFFAVFICLSFRFISFLVLKIKSILRYFIL